MNKTNGRKETNRYISMFKQCLEDPPQAVSMGTRGKKNKPKGTSLKSEADIVVAALGAVNAMSMCGGFSTGNASEGEKVEVVNFVEWFLGRYGSRPEIHEAIYENWPQEPRIFRLYEGIMQERDYMRMQQSWESLSAEEQGKVRTLADIIWSHRCWRKVSFTSPDGSTTTMELKKNIPKDNLKKTKETLLYVIADFVHTGGGLIYRRDAGRGKNTVCGFFAYPAGGKHLLTSYPVDKLRIVCETMPDGSRQVQKGDEYDVITLPWENTGRAGFRRIK